MKHFYIDMFGGCTIVKNVSLDKARSMAQRLFGFQNVRQVREATEYEVVWVEAMGGVIHE